MNGRFKDGENTEEEELLALMEEQSVGSDSGAEGNSGERDLKELWKKLSSPVSQESVIQQWYGAIYDGKKKSYLYVGKAIRRFLEDADGPVSGID